MFSIDKNRRNFSKTAASHGFRLAAIDVGSNAIRMVIAEYKDGVLRTLEKERAAIRLGSDVFQKGRVTPKNLKLAARAFKKFGELCETHDVQLLRAVGTSALRESSNTKAFIELMKRKSGLTIEIIDGLEEAKLVFEAINHEVNLKTEEALLIDVGGGSVELTVVSSGKVLASQSFPFGTVRILESIKKRNLKEENIQIILADFIKPLSDFLAESLRGRQLQIAIGTGGNFEALKTLRGELISKSPLKEITRRELAEILSRLQSMSLKERVEKLGLRPDRADVVVPAASLILMVLTQAGVERLLTPSVGLKDGVLWSLIQEHN